MDGREIKIGRSLSRDDPGTGGGGLPERKVDSKRV